MHHTTVPRTLALTLIFAGATLTSAPAAHAQDEQITYTLNPADSEVYVRVYNDSWNVAKGWSHNHAIEARGWRGTFEIDADDPTKCALNVTVPVKKLVVDPDALRQRLDLKPMDDSAKRKTRENMLASDQLHAKAHPTITLTADSCTTSGARTVHIDGALTVRGESAPVQFEATISEDGTRVSADGRFEMTHSDFGFEPYSAAMGALSNGERLTFVFTIKGEKR